MNIQQGVPKWASQLAKQDQTMRSNMEAQDERPYVDQDKGQKDSVSIGRRLRLDDNTTINSGKWNRRGDRESMEVSLADSGKTDHYSSKLGNNVSVDRSFWESDGTYVEQSVTYNDSNGSVSFLNEGRTY